VQLRGKRRRLGDSDLFKDENHTISSSRASWSSASKRATE
jgi:hypothetical protein